MWMATPTFRRAGGHSRHQLGTLALATLLASACATISGLDDDFELAHSNVVLDDAGLDASTDHDQQPDAYVLPADGGLDACTGECPMLCGTTACSSCEDIKNADKSSTSGVYVIRGMDERPVTVYCDMVIDNGGWILVGKSATKPSADPDAGFGWQSADGLPSDDDHPYSLDVDKLTFAPTQMLFGSAAGGKSWGGNVYRVDLPAKFIDGNESSAIAITRAVVFGDCPGGQMHSYAGYTTRRDAFFFRDNASASEIHGLLPKKWEANIGTSCAFASNLNGLQGMIFIR